MTWPASPTDQSDLDARDSMEDASPLDPAEITDSDGLGSTDAGLDPLDDSWDPPDRPSGLLRNPTTPREERDSSFDRQLAAEVPDPDPYADAANTETGLTLDSDVYGTSNGSEFDSAGFDHLVERSDGIRRERTDGRVTGELAAEEDAVRLDPHS